MYKGNVWLNSGKLTVEPGAGTETITITLDTIAQAGNDYSFRSTIRPVGTNGSEAIDSNLVSNITIIAQTPFGGTAWELGSPWK